MSDLYKIVNNLLMVDSSTQEKEAFLFHTAALFILSLYYLIPYFLTGHLIIRTEDLLEKEIVCIESKVHSEESI